MWRGRDADLCHGAMQAVPGGGRARTGMLMDHRPLRAYRPLRPTRGLRPERGCSFAASGRRWPRRLLRDPRRGPAEELALRAGFSASSPRGPAGLGPVEIATVNQELERLLLHRPQQVFWLHDRFKARPSQRPIERRGGRPAGPKARSVPFRPRCERRKRTPATVGGRRGPHPAAGAPRSPMTADTTRSRACGT